MSMDTPDQADSGGDWRMRLSEMRTVAGLRAQVPSRDAAERLSDRALIAAAQNPDHSEAGRAAAWDAARARNVTVSPWRIRAPGFLAPGDLTRPRPFFGWGWRGRALAGFGAIALALAALALLALELWRLQTGAAPAAPELARCAQGADCAHGQAAAELAGLLAHASSGVLILVAGALASGLAWLMAVLLRQRPARVLVVSAAPSPLTRAPLARFIRKELGGFGHVLAHAPEGPIDSARAYRAAARRMADKFAMNLRSAAPSRVCLRIGGAPAWAALTLAMGADSADCVVIDLSEQAERALAQIETDPRRCVFVALWGRLEAAEAALAARGLEARVHHYAPDGEIQRRSAFRAAMLAAMAATHGAT